MKFISKIIVLLLIVSSIGTTAAFAQGNEQSIEPTCQCQEQGIVLSGVELTKALENAIANSDVQNAITSFEDQGYSLELNQSGAATKNDQTITGLSLVKDGSEFAYIFFNNTTEQVNSFDQTLAESLTDPTAICIM